MQFLGKTYTPFERGNYIHAVSDLISSGLQYLNALDLIRLRVKALETRDISAIGFFLDQIIDTTDGFAFPSEKSEFSGRFKFVPDCDLLLNIKTHPESTTGIVVLPNDESYVSLQGPEFREVYPVDEKRAFALLEAKFDPKKSEYNRAELYELGATPLRRRLGIVNIDGRQIDEIVNSDLWLAFLRGDKQLLVDYRNVISEEIKRRRPGMDKFMGIYPTDGGVKPLIRAWTIEDSFHGSNVSGKYGGPISDTRLIGVSPNVSISGNLEDLARRV